MHRLLKRPHNSETEKRGAASPRRIVKLGRSNNREKKT
jgi:hypothetical protein